MCILIESLLVRYRAMRCHVSNGAEYLIRSIHNTTCPTVLRQQVFSFDGSGGEGGSRFSASPPRSADHQAAQNTVTSRGATVGGNIRKHPALVRNSGVPTHDNFSINHNSSNSNSRRWQHSFSIYCFLIFSHPLLVQKGKSEGYVFIL